MTSQVPNPKQILGKRVLIVEDDVSLLKILSLMLSRKGVVVFEALNGREALEVLKRETVDLVLSDIQMPYLDGLELLSEIRKKDPRIPPVLFLTGQSKVTREESLKLGAAGLLNKPVRSVELIENVSQFIA